MGLTVEVDGLKLTLIEENDRQVLHMRRGGYEADTLKLWAKLIKPGELALDIGAYTGLFSIIAAKRGARVMAFEPMPVNLARMRLNLARNDAHIRVLPVAVSDHEGVATLNYNPRVPLTTGASLEDGIAAHRDAMLVQCITIDSLELQNVAAIKIDVERHEPCVIRGAMQTIARNQPALLIETLDGDTRQRILDLLPTYEAAAILDHRNTLFIPRR